MKSHHRFMEKHSLPFHLLSDEALKVHKLYGTYGEKKLYGKISMGVIRSTFVIDEDGNLIREYRNVRAKGHAERVLREL